MGVSSILLPPSDLEPWRDLRDTIVMVTGASSGIGREFCIDLVKSGCRIIAAARRIDRLKSLCDEINSLHSHQKQVQDRKDNVVAVAVELDVSADAPSIEASVLKAWNAFGRIDALINNAGIRGPVKNPLNLQEEDWDKTFTTNVRGSWLVSKYVGLHMLAVNQGGSIINISSTAGLNRGHLPGGLAYASSKSALNTMTKVMAMELGRHKIRVNCICPGIFKSEITEQLLQKKWFKTVVSKTMPLRELGVTDPALTSLVKYLIHGSSNYVTGPVKNPLNLQEEDWDKTFTTNVRGSWLVSKYVGLHMLAVNQGGSIINISSTAGLNRGHLPGGLAYASSKSALNTMTKVMAMELGRYV